MRKVLLQVQMTLDGFVAGPDGQLDWMWESGTPDPAVYDKVIALADSCDAILMGRKMSREFMEHWENVVDNQPDSPEQSLARRMVAMRKIIFSKSVSETSGRNAEMENGDLAEVVRRLQSLPGKNLMVYGGAGFASSLVRQGLVDEYCIFRNPVAIGQGMSLFDSKVHLRLAESITYQSGKILEKYLPV